ncbi:unnamed protein product [Prunus brigantina]
MEIRIATRGKLGYLTASIAMPAESAPTFDAWTTENLRVKGWHSPSNKMANLFPNIIACFRVFFRNWIIATPHLRCAMLTLMHTRKNSTVFEFIFFFLDWIPNLIKSVVKSSARNLNWISTKVLLMFAVMHNNAPILLVLQPLLMLLSWWLNVPRNHLHLMGALQASVTPDTPL